MRQRTLCVAVLLVLLPALLAQTPTTGQLTGTVKDPSGAVVPNAKLTLLSTAGEERTATTGEDGSYRFPLLPPGVYTLSMDAAGFQPYRATGVTVRITETTELSPALVIAGSATSVDVTSEVPLVQTTSATTGRVISDAQIRELPLPTRNFQQLLTLSPGTVANLSNNTELGRGDVNINVAGMRSTSNNVVVDGTQIISPGTNSTPNISVPAPDSIQEFIVQTSLFDATQGRNAGGNVAAVTKSGENTVHGSAWEFLRNRELNANDFFLNSAGQPRPVLNRNQFGGTLGGPIVKNKTFFFVSYQGTRERNGASLSNSLSFTNIPAGLTNDRGTAALNALGAAFGVPALSPISTRLLQAKLPDGSWAIPSAGGRAALPTIPVVTPLSGISTFREDQFTTNMDQAIGQNNRLSGKVFFSDTPQYQAVYNFNGGNPQQVPGYGGNIEFRNRLIGLTDSHIFTPSLINQAHFGYSRINGPSSPQEPLKNSDVGINNPLCGGDGRSCGLSTISVLGLFTIGSTGLADQKSTTQTFEWTDMMTWTHGKHLVRFGGEARRYRVDFFFNFYSRGSISFSSFQNFLSGTTTYGALGNGVRDRGMRASDAATYIQDDYKVNDSLTLNLGLRFQYTGGISEIRGRLATFDPSVFPGFAKPCTVAAPCTGTTGFQILKPGDTLNPNSFNFAPRFGFAWKPPAAKSVVVRGGYGVYFDRFSTRLANLQILSYPFDMLGFGFGSFANPFPDLSKVSFPINPVAVPSPVPYYYGGVPLPALGATPITGIYPSRDFRLPYVQQYSLGVQWEVKKDWMAEVGYVGSKGTRLINVMALNQGLAGSPTAPYTASGFTNSKAVNAFQMATTDANSIYNSLQTSLTKRFTKGLVFLASYTFAKSIDDASGSPTSELLQLPGNEQDRRSNRGLSDFDRSDRFVLSGAYDLPKFYGGKSAVATRIANNWQFGGIVTLQSGAPFSVICSNGADLYNRADLISATNPAGSGSVQSRLGGFFNKSAFAPTCTNTAPFGTSGRNILRGPDQRNVDLSIVKFIPIQERTKLEFRTEFFNAFNRVNFANPNNNVLVPFTLGTITSTATGPRVMQFALKLSF